MKGYFKNIGESVQTLSNGLRLTLNHLWDAREHRDPMGIAEPDYFAKDKGIVTLQYPKESIPVPDNGRYRLHNEIEDCIVCDKCAKICPVNCIDIEPIRAVEDIGKTSDGTVKRIHAAKFDIDMAKCCFCGLCTTVCPTECLTMTKAYDFSVFDISEHNYAFAEMSPVEILEARKKLEEFQSKKEETKPVDTPSAPKPRIPVKPGITKPVMKPKIGAKPVMKPVIKKEDSEAENTSPKPKPVMKPKIPTPGVNKPVIKPVIIRKDKDE